MSDDWQFVPIPDWHHPELGSNNQKDEEEPDSLWVMIGNLLQTLIGITKFTLEWYLFEFCLISQAFCPQLPSPRLSCNTHRHQPRQFQAAWRQHHETKLVSAFLSALLFFPPQLSAPPRTSTTQEIGRDLYSYMDLRLAISSRPWLGSPRARNRHARGWRSRFMADWQYAPDPIGIT